MIRTDLQRYRARLARVPSVSLEEAERLAQAFQRELQRELQRGASRREREEEGDGSPLTMVMMLALFTRGPHGRP